MTLPAHVEDEDKTMRERKCIVTGEVLPDDQLVRFVVDPDGKIVPDVAATLPGRGLWVRAECAILERAIEKNHFAKAAKQSVGIDPDLVGRTIRQLVQRMKNDLGLARRAGLAVFGFDNVERALASPNPPAVLVEARDGAADGRRKLVAQAKRNGLTPTVMDCLECEELSVALGRENVIHAALKPGRLTDRLTADAVRLMGLRSAPAISSASASADSATARHERDE